MEEIKHQALFEKNMGSNSTISCSAIYNVTGNTYDVDSPDGGIPENLGLNFAIWLIIISVFCVIRRWAWDYGRLALIQRNDNGWAKIFFGKTDEESKDGLINADDSLEAQVDDVSDKGFFNWIIVVFKLTNDDIRRRAGNDAIHYLSFQKFLIYYTLIICVLSIVVILPVNHSGNNVPEEDHYGTTTLANLSDDSNLIWLHTIFACLYLAILVVMVWKFSQGFETDSDPVSQHTILVTHVARNAPKDQINEHFKETYGNGSVKNVQFAYNINKLTFISRKLTAASLGRNAHSEYLMKHGKTKETYTSTSKLCPCCPCYKEKHENGLDYFTEEEKGYKNEFEEEKNYVLRFKGLRIMFVTFTNPSLVLRCVQDYSILGGNYKASSMSTGVKSSQWIVERAPSPGNIIWENLSVDPKYWWIRAALINICLFIVVLFFTTPAILLAGLNHLQSSVEDKVESADSPFLSQFLPTLVLWILTAILQSVVSWSSYYEHQWTRTRQEKFVMFKVYFFLLCMIVILPSLALTSLDALFEMTIKGDFQSISDRLGCVFLPDSGAFFVNYVITSALIGTAFELVRLPELFVYAVRMCYTHNEGERLLVKKEAIIEFPFGIQYAWMIAIYSIIIIYSIACPLVVPFGLLYLLLKHFVDRYNLFFNYRPPAHKHMDRSVHNTALYFLICSTFLLLLCILFYSIIRLGIEDPQTIFTLVIVFMALILFIGKICCGWFSRYSIQRHSPSLEGQEEEIPTDLQTSEAYLPPVLRSSYRVAEASQDDSSTELRRRIPTYGTNNDHVIDSNNLRQSEDVVVDVPAEPSGTGHE